MQKYVIVNFLNHSICQFLRDLKILEQVDRIFQIFNSRESKNIVLSLYLDRIKATKNLRQQSIFLRLFR